MSEHRVCFGGCGDPTCPCGGNVPPRMTDEQRREHAERSQQEARNALYTALALNHEWLTCKCVGCGDVRRIVGRYLRGLEL